MAEWYQVTAEQLSEHIARCLNTTIYSSRIKTHEICGECFFSMMEEPDFSFFFAVVRVTGFQHKVTLMKWWSECKEHECIIIGPPKLAPSLDNSISTALHWQRQEECLTLKEQGKTNDALKKQTSREDSKPVRVRKRFCPTPDEIFNVNCKSQARRFLANRHTEAYEAHKTNFRTVRNWFAHYQVNEEQHEYLRTNFTSNTEVKERCRQYMRSRMKELLPLTFVCPETGSKHEMHWPEKFLFQVVLNRKQAWKRFEKQMQQISAFQTEKRILQVKILGEELKPTELKPTLIDSIHSANQQGGC